jgi:hypothetical protein
MEVHYVDEILHWREKTIKAANDAIKKKAI